MPITRSPAQKPAHKDLGRNGQNQAITPKATYAPVSNRAGSRSLSVSIDIPLLIRYYKQRLTNTVLSVR
ncbi:alpha-galactosidase [Lacticaseibacillus rhamnosus]|nr:alpha-galactosidase [Lacticaseibacillus rhamnosus]MCI9808114.1 alpha-galactosidase [Lacticaseibacillus rhamnosus]